jgi:hypothetical protein
VLGALPAAPGVGLAQFVENPRFRDLLHSSIKKAIEEGKATSVEYEAATRPGDGYMHIVGEC